jgi:hypothetical protein
VINIANSTFGTAVAGTGNSALRGGAINNNVAGTITVDGSSFTKTASSEVEEDSAFEPKIEEID